MILKVWYPQEPIPVVHVDVKGFSAKDSGKRYWRQGIEIREIEADIPFDLFTDDHRFICGWAEPKEWSVAA